MQTTNRGRIYKPIYLLRYVKYGADWRINV